MPIYSPAPVTRGFGRLWVTFSDAPAFRFSAALRHRRPRTRVLFESHPPLPVLHIPPTSSPRLPPPPYIAISHPNIIHAAVASDSQVIRFSPLPKVTAPPLRTHLSRFDSQEPRPFDAELNGAFAAVETNLVYAPHPIFAYAFYRLRGEGRWRFLNLWKWKRSCSELPSVPHLFRSRRL